MITEIVGDERQWVDIYSPTNQNQSLKIKRTNKQLLKVKHVEQFIYTFITKLHLNVTFQLIADEHKYTLIMKFQLTIMFELTIDNGNSLDITITLTDKNFCHVYNHL